jgi:hypothetical protein
LWVKPHLIEETAGSKLKENKRKQRDSEQQEDAVKQTPRQKSHTF